MQNPTQDINLNFADYVSERGSRIGKHMQGGIPDYAFASDYATRQKIAAIPGAFKLGKAITSQVVPRQRQICNMQGLRSDPTSSRKFIRWSGSAPNCWGSASPQSFITAELGVLNAYAVATEDAEPMIVLIPRWWNALAFRNSSLSSGMSAGMYTTTTASITSLPAC